MSNHASEEQIKTLSAEYIYQQAIGSLLLLLISAMEEEEQPPLPYQIPQDIAEIRKEIRGYLLNLEDILDGLTEGRIAVLENCISLKKRLLSI